MKPDGCRCTGDRHINPDCFITPRPSPTIAELLIQLGYPLTDDGIRAALKALVDKTQ